MSAELNKLLKNAYYKWKTKKDPPIPLECIKKYLELEGVSIEDESLDHKR